MAREAIGVLKQFGEFLRDLLQVAVMLLMLGIVAGLLFGNSLRFGGVVVENVTAAARSLGNEGLIAILIAGAIVWLFTRKEPAPAAAPRKAAARARKDDLKLISGVGPALERKLNRMGVKQFSQVAAWSADDIRRIDESLNFKGRIARENWVAQARTLAAGGDTAFSRRHKA